MATKRYKLTQLGRSVIAYKLKHRTLWEEKALLAAYGRIGTTPEELYNRHRGLWWGSPRNVLTLGKAKKLIQKLVEEGLLK